MRVVESTRAFVSRWLGAHHCECVRGALGVPWAGEEGTGTVAHVVSYSDSPPSSSLTDQPTIVISSRRMCVVVTDQSRHISLVRFVFSPCWTDSKFRLHAERCPDPWPLQAADAKAKRRRRRSLGAQIGVRSDVSSILFSLLSLVSCGPPPNFSVSPSDDDTCETLTPDGKVEKDRRGKDGVTPVHHV